MKKYTKRFFLCGLIHFTLAGKILITVVLLMVLAAIDSHAQETDSVSHSKITGTALLKVFLDCEECDQTFLRSVITFVDFVRDPQVSDLHILIVDHGTGSGGRQYSMQFIGKDKFLGRDQQLHYTSLPSDTEDKTREGIAQMIKMGLMPYVSQTSLADNIKIKYDVAEMRTFKSHDHDPWDYWVFYLDLGGEFEGEESRNDINLVTTINADRVTEDWRFRSTFTYEYEEENFTDDDVSIKSTLRQLEGDVSLVKSLSPRWSAGLFGEVNVTTFKNISLSMGLAPAIEYNFFPWSESEFKEFTIAYAAGIRSLHYNEETLFDKLKETLFFHMLKLEVKMIQPWGEVDTEVEISQYPELSDKYAIDLQSDISIRISEGLSFLIEGQIESIHDQIYLPKGDATLDEILLKRKQLATTYDISFTFGFRYTFGSIYNSIVNRRL